MIQVYETLIEGLLEKGFGSVDNWFDITELDCLRKSLLSHYGNEYFHRAGIGKNENFLLDKTIRNDQVYWLQKDTTIPCEKRFFQKMDDFITYLNRSCYAGIREYDFHYAVFEQGTFFKKHIDRFKNDYRRKYSFVCYFTEEWDHEDGGELLMYANGEITTIEPRPGRVLFFNAELPHEVLVANKQRLSLTGWMKTSG